MRLNKYLILIILVATFLRFFHYYELKTKNPIFDFPIVDGAEYVKIADYILTKNFLGPPSSYYHPPFYYYFVAILLKIFNHSINGIKIFQIFLDLLSILMLYYVCKRIFNKKTALVASFIYAIYGPIIKASLEILPSVLIGFLFLFSIFCLLKFYEYGKDKPLRWIWLLIGGIGYGFLSITLTNFLILLPLLLGWLWVVFKEKTLKNGFKYLTIFLLLTLAPTTLVTMRNYLYVLEPVIISYNGGINFYVGNNLEMEKTVAIQPGYQWDSLMTSAYLSERITNFSEQQNYWYKKGINFIIQNPLVWLCKTLKKAILFFNAYEFPRNVDDTFFNNFSIVNRFPLTKADIVFPLSFAGIIFILVYDTNLRKKRTLQFMLLMLSGYAITIILIFITSRYRLPIISLLCIFAGYYIIKFIESIKYKNFVHLTKLIILLAVFIPLTQIKFFKHSYPYHKPASLSYTQIINALTENKRFSKIENYLNAGFALPDDERTYEFLFTAGTYYNKMNNREKAIECFKKSIDLNPNFHYPLNHLGYIYKKDGMVDSAIYYLQKGIMIPYADAMVFINLADCYLLKNDLLKAQEILQLYLKSRPSPNPVIYESLARLYMKQKDYQKAIENFIEAIKFPQGYEIPAEIYNLVGICYYNLHDNDNAKKYWRMGLKKYHNYQPIIQNLRLIGK